ncbi:DNA gyrase subunit A [Clostridium tyrobutyricum]|jgi:DNA gyrase subunit A|uniref:DNA gyrase subunit A n=1 Tax=Clostridium tyrobutyricum DIVETGP TaxID=1408889 RepID=W6N5K3_CLOTY|nr:DNA gyrase subunit A [Clostridium tyrobutyricum]AND83277.1 DNA gyrase subunit A [Clostridium tyrobutyricum]ANP70795.1 DNA gyrase subunit A [Clostridium tyrobutyricum]MBV4416935.1 DNA gyrase subunit A [Clostridium tyrobutyricum]MBV4423026.1 DNA gyrase subunit A [Clostridium tyrobutyricum]MBV4426149.1 DNA gyrase subunit A [Clostridium tyrobutyricum]
MFDEGKILPVDISNEMKKCYIDYAMSVIVGRALPDVRDGLKPVHRRILYSMYELGLTPDKGYRKCARIVGDVLGKYHPHGDTAVYDALVRMAQDFSIRYTLVDGHGNFGSVDGDSAAAMRYTEAKMNKITLEMLREINKNTVDFVPNFDGEEKEPSVLPSRFPNLLVNGSAGIAVGMATNIPPHNLREVINGVITIIDNPDATISEIMNEIKGPDFPTAGIIIGTSGIKSAYETGRGKILVRCKAEIEEEKGRERIIVTELPYQVNKSKLIENIASLVKDKKIEGISDIRDESDREGMRIVIELKRDANSNVILNQLYKHTKMQDTFGIIMIALVNNEPHVLNLKEILTHYLEFQKQVIRRRTKFDLDKALARAHILEGLRIALDHIDEVINLIRSSKTTDEARNGLMSNFQLSEKQAQAILDMRLQRLTGLEREKIENEYNDLMKTIKYLREILENEELLLSIIKDELNQVKDKYGDERRTQIQLSNDDIDIEDLIQEQEITITLTHSGYIKRIAADTYSSQRRGGRGIQAMTTKEDDFVEHIFITSTHNYILFFTNKGRVYKLKGYEIPEAGRTAKGTNIVNLIPIDRDEKIQAVLTFREFKEDNYFIMGTKNGLIKKTQISKYSSIRKKGLNAINLRDEDELIGVRMTTGNSEIIVFTRNGYAIRFSEKDVRPMGRTASGVKAITLRDDDIAVGMEIIDKDAEVLVISENGFGKKTPISEYTIHRRGGKGIITYKISDKTGLIVGAKMVKDGDEMMLINSSNVAIRLNVSDISTTSRNAMGVTLMKTEDKQKVVAIAKINCSDEIPKEEV